MFFASRRIGTGGLINKNKFLNYFLALIALPGGGDNSMQHVPLTFKAQINFVPRNWGYLSGVTQRCVASPPLPPPPPDTLSAGLLQWNFLIFVKFFSHSLHFSLCGAFVAPASCPGQQPVAAHHTETNRFLHHFLQIRPGNTICFSPVSVACCLQAVQLRLPDGTC